MYIAQFFLLTCILSITISKVAASPGILDNIFSYSWIRPRRSSSKSETKPEPHVQPKNEEPIDLMNVKTIVGQACETPENEIQKNQIDEHSSEHVTPISAQPMRAGEFFDLIQQQNPQIQYNMSLVQALEYALDRCDDLQFLLHFLHKIIAYMHTHNIRKMPLNAVKRLLMLLAFIDNSDVEENSFTIEEMRALGIIVHENISHLNEIERGEAFNAYLKISLAKLKVRFLATIGERSPQYQLTLFKEEIERFILRYKQMLVLLWTQYDNTENTQKLIELSTLMEGSADSKVRQISQLYPFPNIHSKWFENNPNAFKLNKQWKYFMRLYNALRETGKLDECNEYLRLTLMRLKRYSELVKLTEWDIPEEIIDEVLESCNSPDIPEHHKVQLTLIATEMVRKKSKNAGTNSFLF